MDNFSCTGNGMSDQIIRFIDQSPGLELKFVDSQRVGILQTVDNKLFIVDLGELEEVIPRWDENGRMFYQVNFKSNKKILLTESLIGFKPVKSKHLRLDMPKVVTTSDLLSIFEAIEELAREQHAPASELNMLKLVFDAVVNGGEDVGFDLTAEKTWLLRLPINVTRGTA